jgi:hypothetical protein
MRRGAAFDPHQRGNADWRGMLLNVVASATTCRSSTATVGTPHLPRNPRGFFLGFNWLPQKGTKRRVPCRASSHFPAPWGRRGAGGPLVSIREPALASKRAAEGVRSKRRNPWFLIQVNAEGAARVGYSPRRGPRHDTTGADRVAHDRTHLRLSPALPGAQRGFLFPCAKEVA